MLYQLCLFFSSDLSICVLCPLFHWSIYTSACEIKKKPYPLYDSFQTFCLSFNLVYDMFCYMENFYFYVVKSVNLFIMVYAFHIMPQKASGTMRL